MSVPREITLPTEVIEPKDPQLQYLLVFAESGLGKSTVCAQLPRALHLNTDKNGLKWIAARKLDVTHFSDLNAILEKVREHRKAEKVKMDATQGYVGKDYADFVVLDTLTYFIPMIVEEAENMFASTTMGKHWFVGAPGKNSLKQEYGTILGLPDGAGYPWCWRALDAALDILEKIAKNVVIVCHTRTNRDDEAVDAKNIDLPGKMVDIVCRRMEAVAHLSRTKDDKVAATFSVGQRISAKSKAPGLDGTVVMLSEKVDGAVVTHWENIFTFLKK